jgi:hypothetical protein
VLRDPERTEPTRGQASVELVSVLPVLGVCLLVCAQAIAAGWALWTAGNAARAGARVEHVGGDGVEAARRALPGPLRREAEVRSGEGLRVTVRVPSLLPGASMPTVSAGSSLNPNAEG